MVCGGCVVHLLVLQNSNQEFRWVYSLCSYLVDQVKLDDLHWLLVAHVLKLYLLFEFSEL